MRTNRKQQAAEMRSTWMVMREPKDIDGNRHTRRQRIAQTKYAQRAEAKRAARAASASAAEVAVSAGGQEPEADRASPSAADSEVA